MNILSFDSIFELLDMVTCFYNSYQNIRIKIKQVGYESDKTYSDNIVNITILELYNKVIVRTREGEQMYNLDLIYSIEVCYTIHNKPNYVELSLNQLRLWDIKQKVHVENLVIVHCINNYKGE